MNQREKEPPPEFTTTGTAFEVKIVLKPRLNRKNKWRQVSSYTQNGNASEIGTTQTLMINALTMNLVCYRKCSELTPTPHP